MARFKKPISIRISYQKKKKKQRNKESKSVNK